MYRTIVFLVTLSFIDVGMCESLPKQWNQTNLKEFESGISYEERYNGYSSGFLKAKPNIGQASRANVWQTLAPCPSKGERYKISAFMTSLDSGTAGLFVEIHGYKRFELEGASKLISGTTPWSLLEAVLVIPSGCTAMNVGFYLYEKGIVWADEISISPAESYEEETVKFRQVNRTKSDKIELGSFEVPR